jgi:hypothetical protein
LIARSDLQRAHIIRSDIIPILLGRTRRAPAGAFLPTDSASVVYLPGDLQARVAGGIQVVICIRLLDAVYRNFRIYIHSDTSKPVWWFSGLLEAFRCRAVTDRIVECFTSPVICFFALHTPAARCAPETRVTTVIYIRFDSRVSIQRGSDMRPGIQSHDVLGRAAHRRLQSRRHGRYR